MKPNRYILFIVLIALASLRGNERLYGVRLKPTAHFKVVPGANGSTIDTLSWYALDASQRDIFRDAHPSILAAGYESGISIQTADTVLALQDIEVQVNAQTGLALHFSLDSRMEAIKPNALLLAFSDTATITFLLTALGQDRYLLSCDYVVRARASGSSDRTAAETASDAEKMKAFSADSKATTFPASLPLTGFTGDDYYHQFMRFPAPGPDGKPVATLALIIKKQQDYRVAFYQQSNAAWALLGQSETIHSLRSPMLTNRASDTAPVFVFKPAAEEVDVVLQGGQVTQVPAR